ncbi:hypothetical protein V8E52_007762, partial [Russula decolorans]
MSSVIQALFTQLPSALPTALRSPFRSPALDRIPFLAYCIECQMIKVADGLLSGLSGWYLQPRRTD